MPTQDFFVTFGYDHVNPMTGESLFNRFVRIPAETELEARHIVIHRLGRKWSMIYNAEQFGGQQETYGLIEWLWTFNDPNEGKVEQYD